MSSPVGAPLPEPAAFLDEQRRATKQMQADILEANCQLFSNAQTYTTVVIFGAYAAFFAIWSFTKDDMTRGQLYWTAILMGVSILVFVLFEVFKMLMTSFELIRLSRLALRELPPSQFFIKRAAAKQHSMRLTNMLVLPAWGLAVLVTLATGIPAAIILLASLAVKLAKL